MTRSVRQTGRDRDERISAAATKLFTENGFDETSVRQIADEAGVTVPAIYRSYGSKDELFIRTLHVESAKIIDALEAQASDLQFVVDATRDTLTSFLRKLAESPTPWMVYEQATRIPKFAEQVDEIRQSFIEKLTPSLHDRIHAPQQDPSAELAASAFVSAWETVATQVATGGSDVDSAAGVISDLTRFDLQDAAAAAPESGAPANPDDDEQLHDLISRASLDISDAWAQAIMKYGVLGARGLSEMADGDAVATEHDLLVQANDGVLLAFTVKGADMRRRVTLYPAFQFDLGGNVLPVMSTMASRLANAWNVETRLLWLTSPNGWLGAQAPADLLATQPDAVLRALDLATSAA